MGSGYALRTLSHPNTQGQPMAAQPHSRASEVAMELPMWRPNQVASCALRRKIAQISPQKVFSHHKHYQRFYYIKYFEVLWNHEL